MKAKAKMKLKAKKEQGKAGTGPGLSKQEDAKLTSMMAEDKPKKSPKPKSGY
jgi:hypothetical protein